MSGLISLRWLAPRTIVIGAAVFGIHLAQAAEPTEGEIDQGRQVYDDFCATCHGRDMVNAGTVTFDLRKFPRTEFERFRKAVLDGKPPSMPSWRDKLGDDDVKLLWAYVSNGGS